MGLNSPTDLNSRLLVIFGSDSNFLQADLSLRTCMSRSISRGVARYHFQTVRNPPERITAREGINAAQAFFEHHGCVFQEVAQQNDFGKDAYVDIGENASVSFLCVAIQVKAGVSYRSAKGDYFIPIDDHAHNWRYSTVPIFGIVYDPDDQLMRWIDITGHLRANPHKQTGSVLVSREAILTEANLRGAFTSALAELHLPGGRQSHLTRSLHEISTACLHQ